MVRRNAGEILGGARFARAIAVALIAGLPLGAGAAEVAEVRVGTHEKSTRIVLELDRASGYRLVAPEDGKPELQIHLDAASSVREVPSKSPLVRKVRVEPSGSGSTVSVKLATPNVAVKELLLSNPPRLVFDLTAQGPIPKAPVEEEVAEKPDAEPMPAVSEKAEPIVVAAAAEPAPHESEATPEPPAAEVPAEAPIAPATEPAPAEPTTPPTQEASPATQEAVSPPAPAPTVQIPSAAAERRDALRAKAQAAQADDSSLMSLATSPLGIGAIGAAVLLLGAIVVMRRRRGSEDEDPLYTVMSADDAGMGATDAADAVVTEEPERAAAPLWEPDAFEASEPALKEGPRQLSLGSRPAPAVEMASEPEEIAPPDDSDSIFGGEPEPVAAQPMAVPVAAAVSEETERRIAELERRIEQLTEARERLERQVAAQTEELRVQRAAIARTQRVVRSIAKTEDMATEPVPRAPSAS